jgi:hypothetical protein
MVTAIMALMAPFQQRGILVREGNNRSGSWMINDEVSLNR